MGRRGGQGPQAARQRTDRVDGGCIFNGRSDMRTLPPLLPHLPTAI